jgi:hypothetical protein
MSGTPVNAKWTESPANVIHEPEPEAEELQARIEAEMERQKALLAEIDELQYQMARGRAEELNLLAEIARHRQNIGD